MTVAANDAIDIYTAVGGEPNFAYTFPIDVAVAPNAHEIVVQNLSGGLITTLVEGVDYSVTGAGNPLGGTIVLDTGVFPSGAVAGVVWTIFRQIVLVRPADFQTSGDFFAADVNLEFDKHIKIMQDISRDLALAISLPTGSGLSGVTIPLPTSGKDYIRWNDAGTQLITENVVTVGTATGVDETDTDATKTKMTSNLLAKQSNDTAQCFVGVQVASFANRFQVSQSLTTVNPKIEAIGTDTDVGWDVRTKGSGAFDFTGLIAANKSADIVTATSMNIGSLTGNYFVATGNNTVNGFTGRRIGTEILIKFSGTPTLTHNATTFKLEGNADIAVPAGSYGRFVSTSLSPAQWEMTAWMPADGLPVTGATFPKGYISGFDIDNDSTDAVNDLLIGVGVCRDKDDTTNIELTASLIKQIDAAYAVGTNQGAYDSASALANSTWYHIHVVKNKGTGVVDIAIDASPTAATFHANNANHASRRIGSVFRGVGTNLGYSYRNGFCYWDAPIANLAGNISTVGAARQVSVPPDFQFMARIQFNVVCSATNTTRVGILTSLASNNTAPANSFHQAGVHTDFTPTGTIDGSQVDVETNTAHEIRERGNSNTTTTWYIATLGFQDYRGRG